MSHKEIYSDTARIQLNLFSYLKISFWIWFGTAVSSGAALNIFVTTTIANPDVKWTMFWLSTLLYSFLGLIVSLLGTLISYPIYAIWCNKNRGQSVRGRFAIHQEEP